MSDARSRKAQQRQVDRLVVEFGRKRDSVSLFLDQLFLAVSTSPKLVPHVHSFKKRVKDADHLREKLLRKAQECAETNREFDVVPSELLTRITDLAGMRILHLYTRQIEDIDKALREIFAEHKYDLLEGPFARTWDDESREFFRKCHIRREKSPSLYTSVHYIVGSASRTKITCEVQVRTLMEEVWGEVDHALNYPHPSESLACREQIKVLARITSSATRLVDSIFATRIDYEVGRKSDRAVAPREKSAAAKGRRSR